MILANLPVSEWRVKNSFAIKYPGVFSRALACNGYLTRISDHRAALWQLLFSGDNRSLYQAVSLNYPSYTTY